MSSSNSPMEPILIESDHDSGSISCSSDEEFFVSSSVDSVSATDNDETGERDFSLIASPSKKQQKTPPKRTASLAPQPVPLTTHPLPPPPPPLLSPIAAATANLSSLSKLLLLNGASISSYTASILPTKSPLVPIQPKPIGNHDGYQVKAKSADGCTCLSSLSIFQVCHICGCYVLKSDFEKHIKEKHHPLASSSQPTLIPPMTILNNATNSMNTSLTALAPAVILPKTTSELSTKILLLSTSTMNAQAITLHMIKCPWCNTNLEHIDVMTGHLMRY